MSPGAHDDVLALLSRRELIGRASAAALGAIVASALPLVDSADAATSSNPGITDATLQAFADTMLPGRRVAQHRARSPR